MLIFVKMLLLKSYYLCMRDLALWHRCVRSSKFNHAIHIKNSLNFKDAIACLLF